MLKAYERGSFMSSAVPATGGSGTIEQKTADGLYTGHAYSVTAVKRMFLQKMNSEFVERRLSDNWRSKIKLRQDKGSDP